MRIAAFYENLVTAAQEEGITVPEALDCAAEAGLEAIYCSGDSLLADPEGLLALFREKGLAVEGFHHHFDFGLRPEDRTYETLIDWALRCGARNVMVVPGRITPEQAGEREELLRRMLRGTADAVACGQARGMDVCIEDYDHLDSPTNCLAGVERFLTEIPGLRYAFDSGNFVCYHEDPLEALRRWKDRVCLMHVKDRWPISDEAEDGVRCADGRYAHTSPVGDGVMPIPEALRTLREAGFDGGLVIELYGLRGVLPALKRSIAWLRGQLG